jgi:hypothetical protein
MAKVVTAILLNFDTFDDESTRRAAMLATPTDAQRKPEQRSAESSFC